MPNKMNRFNSAFSRMVLFSVVLTLGAQLVLVFIGLSYADSMKNSVNDKRKEAVLSQFQHNLRNQMNDVSNLLLLLQTPEFSSFYKNLMNLRDEETVAREKQKLLDKLEALRLRSEIVKDIYFIGENANQRSFRKTTGQPGFAELSVLRMENIRYSKLSDLFLPDQDQFAAYTGSDLARHFRTVSPLLDKESIAALRVFQSDIRDRMIITNKNENGVFIVIVLGDRFFDQALPPGKMDNFLVSVVNRDDRVVWTTADDLNLAPAAAEGSRLPGTNDPSLQNYSNTVKDLFPYSLRIVHTEKKISPYLFRPSTLLFKMALLSVVTLLVTLFISVYFLKRVFHPFRLISRKLKGEMMSGENVTGLLSLPEHLIKKGFQSISLQNKLILVLFATVSVPTIADGILFSQWLAKDVAPTMEMSVQDTGRFSVVSMQDSVVAIETILNQISASEQFQDYVKAGTHFTSFPQANGINLSMFPGLNDVSYFILLDESGNCIYSSIYSNNKDIFNTDTALLQDRDEPYWISSYKDVFNHISAAAMKRIRPNGSDRAVSYLLMVPKESIFENIEFGQINASYVISGKSGNTIYSSRLLTDSKSERLLRFSQPIPGTEWRLSINYVFNEVIEKNRVY
ncbi:MAG: carotenoid epsilon cyclase, partial [Cohnella sp.]|nr:carotenoid epsilon cyclase [Cohnella sp.]